MPSSSHDNGPKPVVVGLNRVLRSFDAPPATTLAPLFADWDRLVGPQVAAHTRPVALTGTTLVVSVSDPAWATQLRWMGDEVVERLTEGLGPGVVETIEVRVRVDER